MQIENFRKLTNVSYTLEFGAETGIPKDRFSFPKKTVLGNVLFLKISFRGEAWAVDNGSNLIIG